MMQDEEQQDNDGIVVNVDGTMARLLYGGLNGGEILVAMRGYVIVSSGREGGMRLWMVMRHCGQCWDDDGEVDDVVASSSTS